MIKEACVETIDQCVRAQAQGADRIELCADLIHDGLTPSHELIRLAIDQLGIPIRVMIRPRPGNFIYSKEEVSQMKDAIDYCKSVGVEGVVFGACTSSETLDLDIITELTEYTLPLKVTIHKAIDSCDDPVDEVRRLKEIAGIDSILTSGKEATAIEGTECLKSMISEADDYLQIIACGKVTDENLTEVHDIIQAKAYHGKRIVGELGRETP
ncbi:copper homeostasis protein CutC [Fulvivirga sp. M361]|uniref:copper homeostasis protein CutC n=1 Tax=Fulvivirga sp. M361 TaxID=2594266 RepID=UPI00117B83BB|nr:copper homeostasis protein CutC [Fulvivirga sp. M361]TRX53359.1 copper homeostasis protein CutC [Fulvivirga sp. M361]